MGKNPVFSFGTLQRTKLDYFGDYTDHLTEFIQSFLFILCFLQVTTVKVFLSFPNHLVHSQYIRQKTKINKHK